MLDKVFAKDYKIVKKLGSGAFGEVYKAIHSSNNLEVAIKLEPTNTKSQQLFYEAKILSTISSDDKTTNNGIPTIYECGAEGQYNFMIMDLFGKSLEDLFISNRRKFTLKTTLMIGYQMVERIEFVHGKTFIHRDIKPDNFVIGKGKKTHKIFLIDFGLSKRYLEKNGDHISYRDNKNLTGTARYASLNTHLGIEQGRRDDIEGIANVLLYFVKGSLPWQNIKANGKKEKYQKILDKKLSIPLEKLTEDLPDEFRELFHYSRTLEFEEKPNYTYLKELFSKMMEREKFEMDFKYCWQKKDK